MEEKESSFTGTHIFLQPDTMQIAGGAYAYRDKPEDMRIYFMNACQIMDSELEHAAEFSVTLQEMQVIHSQLGQLIEAMQQKEGE